MLFLSFFYLYFVVFREQRNKEEKARLEQERLLIKEAELQYELNKEISFIEKISYF